jgi:hypothetical protein
MVDYDRDLVASIAGAVSAYVRDAEPEEVAIEVLTDLEAEGWEIRHPNDSDGGSYQPAPTGTTKTKPTKPTKPTKSARPPARPWDYFRYRRRGPDR